MNVRSIRWNLGINQGPFWNRVGVTQSGGSRYETGRPIPRPVRLLLSLAYGKPQERARALKALTYAANGAK